MRWITDPKRRFNEWRRWFAWHPVRVFRPLSGEDHWVWMEWVERKRFVAEGGIGWECRLPDGVNPSRGGEQQ